MASSICIFCRIAAGEIPADIVYSDDDILAMRDINPQAPVHVLVMPRRHLANVIEITAQDPELLAKLMQAAAGVAEAEGLLQHGFRLVINTGVDGGQTVDHLHAHVLGGRPLGWPPG